jgi:hypothetical protein
MTVTLWCVAFEGLDISATDQISGLERCERFWTLPRISFGINEVGLFCGIRLNFCNNMGRPTRFYPRG